MKTLRNKNKSGFTLIELLVVIAIIGLLASVVLLALNGARAKARDAKRIADIRQMASAMELYYNDNNSYPTNTSGNLGTTITSLGSNPPLNPNYIGIIPTGPTPSDCSNTTANGNSGYYWVSNGTAQTSVYTILFCLGGTTGGYSAGLHTLTPSGVQ